MVSTCMHACMEEWPSLVALTVSNHLRPCGEHLFESRVLMRRLHRDHVLGYSLQHAHHAVRRNHGAPCRVVSTQPVQSHLQACD